MRAAIPKSSPEWVNWCGSEERESHPLSLLTTATREDIGETCIQAGIYSIQYRGRGASPSPHCCDPPRLAGNRKQEQAALLPELSPSDDAQCEQSHDDNLTQDPSVVDAAAE